MRLGPMVAATLLAVPAEAQTEERADAPFIRMTATINAIAFDPELFFGRPAGDMVRIRYRGDDWGWPVWSIAARSGCTGEPGEVRPACFDNRVARMLRVPAAGGEERPRARGNRLVVRVYEAGARTEAEIRDQLDTAGLEWMEADLRACPGAIAMLADTAQAQWGPYVPPPRADGGIVITLHADKVEVDFRVPDGRVRWIGPAHERTPARWATDFAALIEPCWKPASAPAPWRRASEVE